MIVIDLYWINPHITVIAAVTQGSTGAALFVTSKLMPDAMFFSTCNLFYCGKAHHATACSNCLCSLVKMTPQLHL